MSTSSPAANRPLTQAVMAWVVSTPLALSAAGDMQVVELPLNLDGCMPERSLMSADGSMVIGRLANGHAGLWKMSSGLVDLGAYCPIGFSRWGGVLLRDASTSRYYYYHTYDGALQELTSSDDVSFEPMSALGPWLLGGKLCLPGSGCVAGYYTSSDGFAPVPGLPPGNIGITGHISFIVKPFEITVLAGVIQGNGKYGFVSMLFPSHPPITHILTGPDGSQSWVNGINRHGNRIVGEVPLPGEIPWGASGLPNRACIWEVGGSFTANLLPELPGTTRSDAKGVSEWAEVIVGTCSVFGLGQRATVWTSGVPIDLTSHLECAGIATPALWVAEAVSDDGRTILARTYSQFYLVTGFTPTAYSPADLNQDGVTNGIDLATLLTLWGNCSAPCDADINGDGFVEGKDLAELLSRWGSCS